MDRLVLSDIAVGSGEVSATIMGMSGADRLSGLSLTSVVSDVAFKQTSLILTETHISTPYSDFGDSLAFFYNSPGNLSYIVDSVELDWGLREVKIGHEDLKHFGSVSGWEEVIQLEGDLTGTISRMEVDNLSLQLEDGSYFVGGVRFSGLPNLSNAFIELDVREAWLKGGRVADLVPSDQIDIGSLDFTGSLVGFVDDFVARGNFLTNSGSIYSDLNLKFHGNPTTAEYRGNLVLKNFDVGGVLKNTGTVGRVNFSGNIDGVGLTKESADFELSASLTNSEILGRNYDRIVADGLFRSNFFSGSLEIDDKDLNLEGSARIDFSSPRELIEFDLNIDSANLQAFGLSKRPLIVSSHIEASLEELDVNEASGTVHLDSILVFQDNKSIAVSSFDVVAETGELRRYKVESPDFEMELRGDFKVTDLIKDLPRTFREYQDLFTGDRQDMMAYYAAQQPRERYTASLTLAASNLNRYMQFVGIPASLSDDLWVEATFRQRNDAIFSMYAEVDTLRLGRRSFVGNSININASKDLDSLGVLAMVQLASREQDWDIVSTTEDFRSESIWNNNRLDFNLYLRQPSNQSEADINAEVTLKQDTIDMRLHSSVLKAFNKAWSISRDNHLSVVKDKILMENIELFNQNQSVSVDGVISDSLTTLVNIEFENFQMRNLSAILPKRFDGILNGNARLSRVRAEDPMRFESSTSIDSLQLEGILVGNLSGTSSWNRQEGGLAIDYNLQRENIKTIQLQGVVRPFGEDQIDLVAKFDQANFNVIEPFFDKVISDVSGHASGEVVIDGRISRPSLNGSAVLSDGRVTLDYLNTTYAFSGQSRFSTDRILFDKVDVKDRFGNTAVVDGEVTHDNFKNFAVNMQVDHENFELLNTTKSQNRLYYGNAYSTGRLEVLGPVSNILIRADVTTAPNTKISIPLTDDSNIETQSYITFVGKDSVENIAAASKDVNLKGITLDFNVNVTEDAYSELIFDPLTGDIIRGRGDGNLQMNIDTNGEFELFGSLRIKEGAYNFTTSFINKEFQLKPNGTINWYGDPYQGTLDLEATYRQVADPSDWRQEGPQNVSQKAPVLVVLGLKGPMLNPNISFKLELEEQSGAGFDNQSNWSSLLTTINNNEAELKRQVFSLLILRKFSAENSFVVAGNNVIGSSVSEFVSNQLSYWLNQVDDNLEVSIDLGALDPDALNTFQLRLAYTFLDGRLRVTRGGGVTTVVDERQTLATNILGDWSVEYLLTEDGKLRVKVFSRTDQTLSSQDLELTRQPGVSVQYIQSFDELKEFFGSSKSGKQPATARKEEDEESRDSS